MTLSAEDKFSQDSTGGIYTEDQLDELNDRLESAMDSTGLSPDDAAWSDYLKHRRDQIAMAGPVL